MSGMEVHLFIDEQLKILHTIDHEKRIASREENKEIERLKFEADKANRERNLSQI